MAYEATHDNLGRSTIANFNYEYVANENNIDRKMFDRRTGNPYNQCTGACPDVYRA